MTSVAARRERLRIFHPKTRSADVIITDDLTFEAGARPYFVLSESEKYRVKAIMQIATALRDESDLVIFDGADILDQKGRNGLLTLLISLKAKVRALVGMTLARRELLPDLDSKGLGTSLWMEGGRIVKADG